MVTAQLHISDIVMLTEHQEINNFLKVFTNCNEYLIRVFYVGLELREGSTFRFKMGKNSYHFIEDSWREVFDIFVLSHQASFSDHSLHLDFDWKSHLNSCLREPRLDKSLYKLSTDSLKRDPRILHWIITRVLPPRKIGHSWIDQAEVHFMYILQNKFNINWPNYFVSRMFAVRDCNKRSSLCYISMIAKILKHFYIGVPNLRCISPDQTQKFNKSTMTNIGYHMDDNLKVYFYRMKGSGKIIYNYDDPTEFGLVIVEEQPVEDPHHHVNAEMDDTHHEDD